MTTSSCEFCRGAARRALSGRPVCDRCYATYWRTSELLIADDKPIPCEVCSAFAATDITDGHALCQVCHAPVAQAIEEALARLPWALTLTQIAELPETPS